MPFFAAFNCSAVMHSGMACRAERNQVLLAVIAGLAAELLVVNFEIGHAAAGLASPTVSL